MTYSANVSSTIKVAHEASINKIECTVRSDRDDSIGDIDCRNNGKRYRRKSTHREARQIISLYIKVWQWGNERSISVPSWSTPYASLPTHHPPPPTSPPSCKLPNQRQPLVFSTVNDTPMDCTTSPGAFLPHPAMKCQSLDTRPDFRWSPRTQKNCTNWAIATTHNPNKLQF